MTEPSTEPLGATQQVPPPARAAATPPAAHSDAEPVVPQPPATAEEPAVGSGGALPSRAARSEVVRETSLLAGPSFDGFSAGRRGVREEETEAFHPGHQSPATARPRHAATNETGEHPIVGAGQGDADGAASRFTPMRATDPVQETGSDEDATTRIGSVDPDVTTRLGAPSAAEQAERRAAFARGEAERRASAQADLDRLAAERAAAGDSGDEPPTSPWSAPPRDRT